MLFWVMKKSWMYLVCTTISTDYKNVTDRQTDGRDCWGYNALCI